MIRSELVDLNFSNLEFLDQGKVSKLLLIAMQRVSQDCRNRPADKRPRVVTIKFSVTPRMNEMLECDAVYVDIKAETKVPTYQTESLPMKLTRNGLVFNRDFPDEIDARRLPGTEVEAQEEE